MTTPRYRAWQFIHPDFDAAGEFGGLRISPRGGISMVEGRDAIRQAILLLISTVPGERVMRPDYGCNLHRLLFSPNDDTTAGLAIHYVRRALERWEPRVEIVDLDATRHAERSQMLDIVLTYRVRATQQLDQLAFSFDVAGEEV